MKSISLFVFLIACVFSQKIDHKMFKSGKRGENYKVWIYFMDKEGSELIDISQKTEQRRHKHATKTDNTWYDLKVSPHYKNTIESKGLEVENESRWLNAVSVICSKEEIEGISLLPFVKKIEPVKRYKKKYFNELEVNQSNKREFDYGDANVQIEQINAHLLHDQGLTGQGITILLLDTGYDLSHDALNHVNIVSQKDFINDDDQTANENDFEQNVNQDDHGTKILSIIAANSPGNLIGPAFDAGFLLAKTEDVSQEWQQEEDDYVAGLEWGEINGADIASSSLGYADWYTESDFDGNTAITTIAVDIAVGLGLVCVTAVGNGYAIAPADADSVISVGAVNNLGEIASFSTRGPTFDGRIKPEVCAQGVNVWAVSGNNNSDFINIYNGTSASTPLIAGAAALLLQALPTLSPMEIREAVLMTASMSDNPNNTYGWGIMDAAAALDYWATSNTTNSKVFPSTYNLLKTYPNPFNPFINIEIISFGEMITDVSIVSLNGQYLENIFQGEVVNSKKIISWNPNNLSSGIYLVRLVNDKEQKIYKKITYLK